MVFLVFSVGFRSMICVEGECTMNKFQTKDGTPASALSIVQSEFLFILVFWVRGSRGEAHADRVGVFFREF